MLVLKEYSIGDMHEVNKHILTVEQVRYYIQECYLRTFIDTDTNTILAVGMVSPHGEIGLIVNEDRLKRHIKKFYTLLTIFATEGFNYSNKDLLYTGIKPDSKFTRWIKYLDFTKADVNHPAHEERGWTTYELPLRRWVQ